MRWACGALSTALVALCIVAQVASAQEVTEPVDPIPELPEGWTVPPEATLDCTESPSGPGVIRYVTCGMMYDMDFSVDDSDTYVVGETAYPPEDDGHWTYAASIQSDDQPAPVLYFIQGLFGGWNAQVYVPQDAEAGWDAQLVVSANNAGTQKANDGYLSEARTIVATSN